MQENESLDEEFLGPDKKSTEYTLGQYEIEDAEERIAKARGMLYFIGAFTIGLEIFLMIKFQTPILSLIVGIIIGCVFFAAGFLTKKHPITALTAALVIYSLIYIALPVLISPDFMFRGIIMKMIVISMIVIGIYNAFVAQKTKKRLGIE